MRRRSSGPKPPSLPQRGAPAKRAYERSTGAARATMDCGRSPSRSYRSAHRWMNAGSGSQSGPSRADPLPFPIGRQRSNRLVEPRLPSSISAPRRSGIGTAVLLAIGLALALIVAWEFGAYLLPVAEAARHQLEPWGCRPQDARCCLIHEADLGRQLSWRHDHRCHQRHSGSGHMRAPIVAGAELPCPSRAPFSAFRDHAGPAPRFRRSGAGTSKAIQ